MVSRCCKLRGPLTALTSAWLASFIRLPTTSTSPKPTTARAVRSARTRAWSSRSSANRWSSLRAERLAELALPERLQDAIVEAKRLKSFGAKRRQAQYIGKILRKLDEEMLAAIRKAVARR